MNQQNRTHTRRRPGHGAVGVLVEHNKFLVIRRSHLVRAPNLLCFAGGTIESGENPMMAIEREMLEELNLVAKARHHLWQSRTAWGTLLEWVLVERQPDSQPEANPEEVAEWMWMTPDELLGHPDILPSVPDFFVGWAAGEFELPSHVGQPNPDWQQLRNR